MNHATNPADFDHFHSFLTHELPRNIFLQNKLYLHNLKREGKPVTQSYIINAFAVVRVLSGK